MLLWCLRRFRNLWTGMIVYTLIYALKFQQLNKVKNFGLCRNDVLAVVKNMSGPQSGKLKRELRVLFKEFGLNLNIEYNKTTIDYPDITLNLLDWTYKSYQKPENTVHSPRIQSPSKHHQTNSNYNRNRPFIPFIRRNSFPSCSRRLWKDTQKSSI